MSIFVNGQGGQSLFQGLLLQIGVVYHQHMAVPETPVVVLAQGVDFDAPFQQLTGQFPVR